MPSIVPVLEFVHALNSAGVAADYATTVANPTEQWNKLPVERREAFLVEHGAEGTAQWVSSVSAVKRRGRAADVENVFIMIEFSNGRKLSGSARRAGARMLYSAFTPAAPVDGAEELLLAMDSGGEGGRLRVLHVLDAAWGGEPYDVAHDGEITRYDAPAGYREKERYWLEEPFSMAVILEGEDHELLYHVQEPQLTGLEEALLSTLNDRLRDVLILQEEGDAGRAEFLLAKVFQLLGMYRLKTDRRTAYKPGYGFLRNYLGLRRLEPIMHDVHVEDISCNGPNLPVFVAHNAHQSMRTNIAFDEMELNTFTVKLAQRGGKLLSIAQPLVDASLPGGSRIQAVLGHEITSRGSAFTIRKFREDPLTAVDLVKNGTHSLDTMAMLWLAVEMRRSILVM